MNLYSISKQGKNRTNNEDSFLVHQFEENIALLAVADGMGGHAAGEVASKIVIEELKSTNIKNIEIQGLLVQIAQKANKKIKNTILKNPSLAGMGTTLTAALLNAGKVDWVHIGDTRMYLFRAGLLSQITNDHTIPFMLVKEGKISIDEARNHPMRHILLQCIGNDQFDMNQGSLDVQKNDLLLLSTDGLHDILDDFKISSILNLSLQLKYKLEMLVEEALRLSSKDDITVVGVEI